MKPIAVLNASAGKDYPDQTTNRQKALCANAGMLVTTKKLLLLVVAGLIVRCAPSNNAAVLRGCITGMIGGALLLWMNTTNLLSFIGVLVRNFGWQMVTPTLLAATMRLLVIYEKLAPARIRPVAGEIKLAL